MANEQARATSSTVLGNVRALGYPDRNYVTGSCTAIRREFLAVLLPFPPAIAYDSWVNTMADLLQVRVVIDAPLQAFRRHGSNTTHSIFAQESPTRWGLIRRYGLADPRHEWDQAIEAWSAYRQRIRDRSQAIARLIPAAAAQAAVAESEREIEHWSRRRQVLSTSRMRRPTRILRLWLEGFYAHFSGAKSALKDLLRP